ncbi:MAG: ATP-binding protein, partial [Pseudomonadota bacterium]
QKRFKTWLRTTQVLEVQRSKEFKLMAEVGESERDFRARLQLVATEQRDVKVAALREKYGKKIATLEERLRRANQTLEKEEQQANQKKMDSLLGAGSAILGVLLGRKKFSTTSANKVRRAVSGFGSSRKEAGDVERARETVAAVEATIAETADKLQDDIDALTGKFDVSDDELQVIKVKPSSTEMVIHVVGLVWVPYYRASDGAMSPAF